MPRSRNCASNPPAFPATPPHKTAGSISARSHVMANVTAIGRKSDAQAQDVAIGKANMIDVVTAVAESETAIQTLVSVRDKVIAAYEEILRMPI